MIYQNSCKLAVGTPEQASDNRLPIFLEQVQQEPSEVVEEL